MEKLRCIIYFFSKGIYLSLLVLFAFLMHGAYAQVGHWVAGGFSHADSSGTFISSWKNHATGKDSSVNFSYTSESPTFSRGGVVIGNNTRIQLLDNAETKSLLDFSTTYETNDRKAGKGVSVFLVFRTPEVIPSGFKYLYGNGNNGSLANRGFSMALGGNNDFNFSMGDGEWLFDGAAILQPDTTYTVAVNYNATTQNLELYNSLSKRFVSRTVLRADYSREMPLMLGGLNTSGQTGIATYYEVKVNDRALSAQQIVDETQYLQAKWEGRNNLVQHFESNNTTSFTMSGASIEEWLDKSGNNTDARRGLDSFFYSEGVTIEEKAAGVSTGSGRASLILQDQSKQKEWLDFSPTGLANSHSGFTLITTFKPSEFQPLWNELLGNDKLVLRMGSDGSTNIKINDIGLGTNYKVAPDELITYIVRYDATSEELEFWDSGSGESVSKTLLRGDFSSSSPLRIGFADNRNEFFIGDFFEIKIYSEKLSEDSLAFEQEKQIKKWQPTQLPIEVLGAEGTTKEEYFFLDSFDADIASHLWLQVNNLGYKNKGSLKVNDGTWIDLNHETCELHYQENAYGGMAHGGFNTIRFKVPVTSFRPGLNCVEFRFNESDAISIGYRVIDCQVLDHLGITLLNGSQKQDDDPSLWEAPYTDTASRNEGEMLWRGVTSLPATELNKVPESDRLWNHYKEDAVEGFWYGYALGTRKKIRATCADCHTQDGRDLEMFAYSNHSIIERSKYHGLTEDQGKKIASYIRSLSSDHGNVERVGRPWNPPYQPGPEVADLAIHNWAAGAGLDAVLEKDSEMVPHVFGTEQGVVPSQAQINHFFNTQSTFDSTTIPLAIQMPDWKHWLPMVHPIDAWGDFWINHRTDFPSDSMDLNFNVELAEMRELLKSAEAAPEGFVEYLRTNLETFHRINREMRSSHREFFSLGSNHSNGGGFRAADGDAVGHLSSDVPREFAATSLSRFVSIKLFEIYNEFNLQDKAFLITDKGRPRSWFGREQQVFSVPPHIHASHSGIYRGKEIPGEWVAFLEQPRTTAQFESTAWYELQAILNHGDGLAEDASPVHYNYAMPLVRASNSESGIFEPMRYLLGANRMYQSILGDERVESASHGSELFYMRNKNPWYIFPRFDEDPFLMMDTLSEDYPEMGDMMITAHLKQFSDEMERVRLDGSKVYNLATWPRSNSDYSTVGNDSLMIDEASKSFYDSTLAFHGKADRFYFMLTRLMMTEASDDEIQRVLDWCEEAWPGMPWSDFDLQRRALFIESHFEQEVVRNSDVMLNFTLKNIGTEAWSADSGYKIAIRDQNTFLIRTHFSDMEPIAGGQLMVAWGFHRNFEQSHYFSLNEITDPAKFAIHIGRPADHFSYPESITLYRDGIEVGRLTGERPAVTGEYAEWALTITDPMPAGNYELRITKDETGGFTIFDNFVVTNTVSGDVIYRDLIDSEDRWTATLNGNLFDEDYFVIPEGVTINPGEFYTFQIPVNAPVDEGVFDFDIQMLSDAAGWFGEANQSKISIISHLRRWSDDYGVSIDTLSEDSDGDGRSDFKEYVDGSNPMIQDENPSPVEIEIDPSGDVRFNLSRRQDKDIRYVLKQADGSFVFEESLAQPAPEILDNGSLNEISFSIPKDARKAFFRIDAELVE